MVVVMVMGFLVCWLPYASFSLWIVTHRGEPFDVSMASIPSVFSKASTVYNPVIYVFMNKQVSIDTKQLGPDWAGQERRVKSSSHATYALPGVSQGPGIQPPLPECITVFLRPEVKCKKYSASDFAYVAALLPSLGYCSI